MANNCGVNKEFRDGGDRLGLPFYFFSVWRSVTASPSSLLLSDFAISTAPSRLCNNNIPLWCNIRFAYRVSTCRYYLLQLVRAWIHPPSCKEQDSLWSPEFTQTGVITIRCFHCNFQLCKINMQCFPYSLFGRVPPQQTPPPCQQNPHPEIQVVDSF